MFVLTKALAGAGGTATPAFWLNQGNTYGFVVSVELRSLSGEIESQPLGLPVNLGRFFWVPVALTVGDETAVDGYPEIESPAAVQGGRYWEYLGIEDSAALAIMSTGVESGEGTFLAATKESLPVGFPVDWVYIFDLSAKAEVSVIEVECLGQVFSEAANPAAPAPGEWVLVEQLLYVYGSELNQLHDEIVLTTVFSIATDPESFWIEFSCEWLNFLVVEQVNSFGQVFTAAENPWHPGAGEYLISSSRLFLFTSRPIFPVSTSFVRPGAAGVSQFLGEVAI